MRIKIRSLVALGLAGMAMGQKETDSSGISDKVQPPGAIVATIDSLSDIVLGVSTDVSFTVESSAEELISMLLCQSSVDDQDTTRREIRALSIQEMCVPVSNTPGGEVKGTNCPAALLAPGKTTLQFTITNRTILGPPSPTVYYFFCLAAKGQACGALGVPFNIGQLSRFPAANLRGALLAEAPVTPLFDQPLPYALPLTETLPPTPHSTPTSPPSITGTTWAATVTTPTNPTSTSEPYPSVGTHEPSKGGLSVGAKAGIAVGAVALALILLLLALFCLRRKRRQRRVPEQVMLNQSTHTDSRDLITEKEISAGSFDVHSTAFSNSSPISTIARHPPLAPFETPASRPYSGSAAAIPRRSPTANSFTDAIIGASAAGTGAAAAATIAAPTNTVSREVSNASSTVISPRSTRASLADNAHFEEYHDVPVYGDARHSPQIYSAASASQQAPHLGESGGHSNYASLSISADEAARLREEEEERKIDAAIAEADRAKAAAAAGQLGRL